MRRYRVIMDVSYEDDVMADDAGEAIRIAKMRVEGNGDGAVVLCAEATEIAYERPGGTDRWAPVCDELRFAEGQHVWFRGEDGFWWWTNGHAALKCIAPCPSSGHLRPELKLSGAVGDHRRRAVALGPAESWHDLTVRRAVDDPRVVLNDDYVRLVECGMHGRPVRWMASVPDVADPAAVSVLAYDEHEIVAVVMGIRDVAATP